MRVLRAMRAEADGLLLVGASARYLTARRDISVPMNENGTVEQECLPEDHSPRPVGGHARQFVATPATPSGT